MKVLTVYQPWAWAIIHGPKRIENRAWDTSYRGPLLIHAAKSRKYVDVEDRATWPDRYGIDFPPLNQLAFGAIIGCVNLYDCVPLSAVNGQPFADGPHCLLLASPAPIKPFLCPGQAGLWDPPPGLARLFTPPQNHARRA